MRKTKKVPNLFLRRDIYFENCTVGSLYNSGAELICRTLEPRWRDLLHGERLVAKMTCIPSGTYTLKWEYDDELRYKCLKLGSLSRFVNIRLCFYTKAGSNILQTDGNILLGMDWDQTAGMLADPPVAFRRLKEYFESEVTNRRQMVMQVSDKLYDYDSHTEKYYTTMPRAAKHDGNYRYPRPVFHFAIKAESVVFKVDYDQEDYMLQTV